MKILPFSCFDSISFIALQAQHWELGICGTTTVQYLEFQTLKRFQICISADARNKNQILMLIKDDKKDLFSFFLSIRKDKSEGMGTNPLPKMHRGHRNNH